MIPEFLQFAKITILAVGTNPFFEHMDIRVLFAKVNKKLQNINEWFIKTSFL